MKNARDNPVSRKTMSRFTRLLTQGAGAKAGGVGGPPAVTRPSDPGATGTRTAEPAGAETVAGSSVGSALALDGTGVITAITWYPPSATGTPLTLAWTGSGCRLISMVFWADARTSMKGEEDVAAYSWVPGPKYW